MKPIHLAPLVVAFSGIAFSQAEDLPKVPGPFEATQDSLTQYECPDWFRDAKFGIWSHWGPQSVPMGGDWYARHLYTEDNFRGNYQHHLKNYGHPSEQGWKDILPLWKAEKFDQTNQTPRARRRPRMDTRPVLPGGEHPIRLQGKDRSRF
ncbi:MAG: alpha-L-fucosidase [Akkermansiaceae bacterium]|nr:alpha-L-fucosidase [Akkermansiaceae bacterium]MDP4721332.1 alpha-L-fucosidase [Akkermansiaceae bacterium]MDP4779447.1 alpha-L-fucosidase [Akkermansiaceae bacterium]MDP4846787.1 alpha-L-fucosidase [Akkermansiaceae bacterium]MDP4897124.1 alpha-L-fucosidase [Akkermansiaceae bacterium]